MADVGSAAVPHAAAGVPMAPANGGLGVGEQDVRFDDDDDDDALMEAELAAVMQKE